MALSLSPAVSLLKRGLLSPKVAWMSDVGGVHASEDVNFRL